MSDNTTTYNIGVEQGLQYQLRYTGQQIDELLAKVNDKSIYQEATESTAGLMSPTDKEKMNGLPEEALSADEISSVLK